MCCLRLDYTKLPCLTKVFNNFNNFFFFGLNLENCHCVTEPVIYISQDWKGVENKKEIRK